MSNEIENTDPFSAITSSSDTIIITRIKKRRIDLDMTQAHLADITGLATSQISAVENAVRLPSADETERLERYFGEPIAELITLIDVPLSEYKTVPISDHVYKRGSRISMTIAEIKAAIAEGKTLRIEIKDVPSDIALAWHPCRSCGRKAFPRGIWKRDRGNMLLRYECPAGHVTDYVERRSADVRSQHDAAIAEATVRLSGGEE
jgi:transcriptional regulator with XRE-family HTH domain